MNQLMSGSIPSDVEEGSIPVTPLKRSMIILLWYKLTFFNRIQEIGTETKETTAKSAHCDDNQAKMFHSLCKLIRKMPVPSNDKTSSAGHSRGLYMQLALHGNAPKYN